MACLRAQDYDQARLKAQGLGIQLKGWYVVKEGRGVTEVEGDVAEVNTVNEHSHVQRVTGLITLAVI